MKYNAGDFLVLKCDDTCYLSGLVLGAFQPDATRYSLVLASEVHSSVPSPEYFAGASLLGEEFGMGGQSFRMLDAIVMSVELVDQSADVQLGTSVPFNGLVAHGGFEEMKDLQALKDHYDTQIRQRQGPGFSQGDVFKRKFFWPLAQVVQTAVVPGAFPTVRLYREWEGDTFYWQLLCMPGETLQFVVSQGMLGGSRKDESYKGLSESAARRQYDELIEKKKSEGYEEKEYDQQMTLRFNTNDAWGDMTDLEFRHEMEDYLGQYLYLSGNGAVSGGDIGSGTINVFFEVLSPEFAVATVLEALAEKKVDRSFEIVHVAGQGGTSTERVLYPVSQITGSV